MSSDHFTEADPFEANVLDEQTELRAMTRALDFAEGFGLIFARCNQSSQRERLIKEIRKELPELKVKEIHFTEPVPHLLDALRERLIDDSADAVFVSGLEYSLPVAAEAHLTPFVANLNASRNSFPSVIPAPLVLWLPEYVLTAIIRGAPDFFSIRSGVYSFAATPDETADLARSLIGRGEFSAFDLTHEEKRERIAAIDSLLKDYEALHADQRNIYVEQNLRYRIGFLLYSVGAYSAAQQQYNQVLKLAKKTENKLMEANALRSLGNIEFMQNQRDHGASYYRDSLDIYRQVGSHIDVAAILDDLGILYAKERNFVDAELSYKEALDIFRRLKAPASEALTLIHLGSLYMNQGDLNEAEATINQALEICEKSNSIMVEGEALAFLGLVYLRQGQIVEAKLSFENASGIYRKIGLQAREAVTLRNLAYIEESNGNFANALKLAQQAVDILEKTEDTLPLSEAREYLAGMKNRIENHSDETAD